jgi:hypothetical protein
VHIRGVVITGAVKTARPQVGYGPDGRPAISAPGDFLQTSRPDEALHKYCKAHKPKE